VVAGQFRIDSKDQSIVLQPGQALLVARGVQYSAEVIGARRMINLDAVKV
jgi:hypothetical protein